MEIESIIYIYGLICLSMIIFNIVYNFVLQYSEPRSEKQLLLFNEMIEEQFELLRQGRQVDAKHLNYLRRKLRRVNNLIAFEHALQPAAEDTDDAVGTTYLYQIQPVILELAYVYERKENMQAAYFSYFLTHYMSISDGASEQFGEIMLDYVRKPNLYCRVNALQALYALGNAERVLEALKIQDNGEVFFHEKILTEGLLSFAGNPDELIQMLWTKFDSFSEHTQLAVLNFIRFESGQYCDEMYAIMQNETRGKELRLAAIRYFGKYYDHRALEPLLQFASDQDRAHWEYATVSISSLAQYPGEHVIDVLKAALHSPNWYVRHAASISLEAHDVDYADLIDIVAGDDRYAREMMLYRLESRKLQKESVKKEYVGSI